MQGVLKFINEKEWQGRDGVVKLHSFKLEGDSTLYRTGETPIPYVEGDAIEFELSPKGKNNVDLKTVRKLEKEEIAGSASLSAVVASAVPSSVRQDRIEYQSARKVALDFVLGLVEQKVLPLPTKTKGNQAEAVLEYVEFYTAEFCKSMENYFEQK